MKRSAPQGLRRVLALLLGLVVALAVPAYAAAKDTVAFTISDDRITESSGLARDPNANLYWTVNDSGGGGTVYGLTPKGKVMGTLNFRGAPQDAEAVAMFGDRLYIADIGDNNEERDYVTIFLFPQPRASGLTVMYRSFDFEYPDGKHDAETLLVDKSGRFYIVTKEKSGGAIYAAPEDPSRSQINQLKKVGAAPALVTDGVFLPNGTQIALRTYTSLEIIDAKTYASVMKSSIPLQPQGESLAVSLDGKSLLLGSEGKKSTVYAVPIPASATPTPKASTTSTTGTDDDGTGDDADDDATTDAAQSRTGTFLALGLAAFVAIVAGVVVAAVRKPDPASD